MISAQKFLPVALILVVFFVAGFFLGIELPLGTTLTVGAFPALASAGETVTLWIGSAGFLATILLGIFFFIFVERRSFEPRMVIAAEDGGEPEEVIRAARLYVQEARQTGWDDAAIRAELQKVGWRTEDIESALRSTNNK